VALALFDLDNTLIAGDSDHLWGEFLCRQGIVDRAHFASANDRYYADYQRGVLDIGDYLRFALAPLAGRRLADLEPWRQRFMEELVTPLMLPEADRLLDSHRGRGDRLLIITATNELIAEPIAAALGVDEFLGCQVEIVDGVVTGRSTGVPTYRDGKVQRLSQWLETTGESLTGATFYSDSHNDLPLLEAVDYPVAVDPDPALAARAGELGWPVISLRD